jgi:hypothetical protein
MCFKKKGFVGKRFILGFLFVLLINFVSSAYLIDGYVNDALDGEPANNHIVVLWNEVVGPLDNLTDIIGPNGDSGVDNSYIIDCSLLATPCKKGDNLTIRIIDSGDSYIEKEKVYMLVGKGGSGTADNMTLNSLPDFESIVVDDLINLTENEIDLIANNTVHIDCEAIVFEYDGESLVDIESAFYYSGSSFLDINDNNYHYENYSCFVNTSYGNENQTKIVCSYDVFYYAVSDTWTCEIKVGDGKINSSGTDQTFVNSLLSIGLVDSMNFSVGGVGEVSDEIEIIVSNFGNVEIDLNLWGYSQTEGDNLAMNCTSGDIPVYYKKYNLTSSVSGNLTLGEFESNYVNLTGMDYTADFNLSYRLDDLTFDAFDSTFWRIYVPNNVSGICQGNIVFGAVVSV